MVEQMPEARFPTQGLRRSQDGKLKFWGNIVHDIDAFNHRFFKNTLGKQPQWTHSNAFF